jgi:hypothetical protein
MIPSCCPTRGGELARDADLLGVLLALGSPDPGAIAVPVPLGEIPRDEIPRDEIPRSGELAGLPHGLLSDRVDLDHAHVPDHDLDRVPARARVRAEAGLVGWLLLAGELSDATSR